jgi:hypothetical protein
VNVHNLKPDATPRNIEHAASLSRKRTCLPYPRIIYVDRVSERPVEISFPHLTSRILLRRVLRHSLAAAGKNRLTVGCQAAVTALP